MPSCHGQRREALLTQKCKLSIITETTVRLNCFVQLYEKYFSRCTEPEVAKDAFYLIPRRGLKYFDDSKF